MPRRHWPQKHPRMSVAETARGTTRSPHPTGLEIGAHVRMVLRLRHSRNEAEVAPEDSQERLFIGLGQSPGRGWSAAPPSPLSFELILRGAQHGIRLVEMIDGTVLNVEGSGRRAEPKQQALFGPAIRVRQLDESGHHRDDRFVGPIELETRIQDSIPPDDTSDLMRRAP